MPAKAPYGQEGAIGVVGSLPTISGGLWRRQGRPQAVGPVSQCFPANEAGLRFLALKGGGETSNALYAKGSSARIFACLPNFDVCRILSFPTVSTWRKPVIFVIQRHLPVAVGACIFALARFLSNVVCHVKLLPSINRTEPNKRLYYRTPVRAISSLLNESMIGSRHRLAGG